MKKIYFLKIQNPKGALKERKVLFTLNCNKNCFKISSKVYYLQTERNLSRKLTARVKTSGLVEWARAVSVHTESIQSVTMKRMWGRTSVWTEEK